MEDVRMEDTVDKDIVSVESLRVRLESQLMRLPGVVGVGTGRSGDAPCLVVYTSEPVEAVQPRLPQVLSASSVRVELRYVGVIRAQVPTD